MRTLLAAIAAVAIVGCARQADQHRSEPVAAPAQTPAPPVKAPAAPVARVTSTPIAASAQPSLPPSAPPATLAPAALPTIVPTAVPTQTPAATAAPTVDLVPQLPPDAAPQIVALHIDRTTLRGGETVTGSIITSSNVASVEARIGYYSIAVPKVGEGRFALRYVVPNLPFFLHRSYTMAVIARNVAGTAVVRTVPIRIR
ncbi:MAG TPA: hypothetical protein VMF11_05460 [Candidatus Baltobacteraceae bacterium]|nr:hypothetical protein [Candidatus Baltobacteraceae bacterium]